VSFGLETCEDSHSRGLSRQEELALKKGAKSLVESLVLAIDGVTEIS
jgi:hypothetical protein